METITSLISTDRVERRFARENLSELWFTDITEHPTRGQGLLRRGTRRALPARDRLLDRLLPDGRADDQHFSDGDRLPAPTAGTIVAVRQNTSSGRPENEMTITSS